MAKKNPIVDAYNKGREEGRKDLRVEVLTMLEAEYLNPRVVRETPLAEGILELARKLSEAMPV